MRAPGPKSKAAGRAAPKPVASGIETALVEQLGEILNRLDLSEIETEYKGMRIYVARDRQPVARAPSVEAPMSPPAAAAHSAPALPATALADHPGLIKSPMVGTAYRRSSPESRPFVETGSQVRAGDRVMLVEAMKTFNEIIAPRGGVVTQILIEDGQPVEYGEPLMVIE